MSLPHQGVNVAQPHLARGCTGDLVNDHQPARRRQRAELFTAVSDDGVLKRGGVVVAGVKFDNRNRHQNEYARMRP